MSNRIGGVIIATGFDDSGERLDPLMQLGKISIVRRLVMIYQRTGISPIVIITGFDAMSVERHLAIWGVIFSHNEQYRLEKVDFTEGILPSVKYLAERCEDVVITPVGYPLYEPDTLTGLVRAEGSVRIPTLYGEPGFPIVIRSADIPDIRNISPFYNWNKFLEGNRKIITFVPTEDRGVRYSAQQPDRCMEILESHDRKMLHPYIEVNIDCPVRIFDQRIKMLLLMLDETGTMKTASTRTAISVGNAWKLLNELEAALGYPVVNRRQGGKHGGSTELTPEGKEFLRKYILFEKQVRAYADKAFFHIFG